MNNIATNRSTTATTPRSFFRTSLATFAGLVLTASTVFAPAAVAHADASQSLVAPSPVVSSAFEATMLNLVNQDRAANGLAPVDFDASLLQTARDRAADQIPQPALNHYDGTGQLAFVKLLARDGVYYRLAGENLARLGGLDDSIAPRAEDALMHSPTHRANILEPAFNRMAVGATLDSQGRVVLAQIFRSSAD